MGLFSSTLGLPVSGPLGALQWIARQVHDAAMQQILDPARIESGLRALENDLDSGRITEAEFEAEEAKLLEELLEIRAIQKAQSEEQAEAQTQNLPLPPTGEGRGPSRRDGKGEGTPRIEHEYAP